MALVDSYPRDTAKQAHFNPYSFNGGTILAISGDDFCLVASDTRLSEGFSIHSRESPKLYQLTGQTILAATGFHGDALTLTKSLKTAIKNYQHDHGKQPSSKAIAALLATRLYYRRFFPYYVYNIVAGLDEEGKGAVYSYDPVGSYERSTYIAAGSSGALLQPLLDNQIGYMNQGDVEKVPLTAEKALKLAKDVFISASERDIYTGDSIEIRIITKDNVESHNVPLRRD